MKQHPLLLCLSLLGLALLVGCNKESSSGLGRKTTASAEPTSFAQVTSQLDPGGNLYVYLSTEQLLHGLASKVAGWRQLPESLPNVPDNQRENLGKAIDVITNLINDSGLEEISGFGMSSIAREKDFYHTKSLLHHYKGQGKGFLWNLCGQTPHELTGLNLLPTQTAFATFSDLSFPMLWSVIQKETSQSGFPQAEEFLARWPQWFEQSTGLKWDQVLASLGGEFGFVLTLDETRKITLPLPSSDGPLEIPEPGLMLAAKVKDDTIFNRIEQALNSLGQNVITNDKAGLKMRTVAIPLPLPIQLRPTLATTDGYLLIATSDALINEALAVKAGQKPGLKSTDEFKRLAREMPTQGNQCSFLSQRFGQTILRLQRQALAMAPDGARSAWLQSMLGSTNGAFAFSVCANTEEGWVSTANGNQHPAKLLLAAAAVPVAVAAAVALPAAAKAKERAQRVSCVNNLRQLQNAKKQWAKDNQKSDTDVPTRVDLRPFFPDQKFPACPSGGRYTINAVSELPECSHSGHSLSE